MVLASPPKRISATITIITTLLNKECLTILFMALLLGSLYHPASFQISEAKTIPKKKPLSARKLVLLPPIALWVIVNWFDALVLDCLWFCHDKHFVIPGTEDMTEAYHDYGFHIKGAFIGMLLGIPAALVAGLFVILL